MRVAGAHRRSLALLTVAVAVAVTALGPRLDVSGGIAGSLGPGIGPATAAAAAPTRQIAVVTPYMANATTRDVIRLFERYAAEKGWKVSTTDTAGDFNRLVGAIENAVALKVDAIVLGMGDPAQMSKGLKEAQAAGIPVFGIDAGLGPGVLANVTSDNAALGRMSARDLIQRIGEKGNVVMFTHDPHPGVNARARAAEAEFARYPGIKVVAKRHINVPGPVDNARKVMQDLLAAYPQPGSIAGVWAAWDEPAIGAVQALNAAGRREVAVVGVDGTDFAVAEIKKGGPFKSSVAQDWDAIARRTVELVQAYFDGQRWAPQVYTLPGRLITQETLAR
ncbi:MAG: substrate-binding domain-containing protein [Limnochordaceae bacterium]|nr:substrate-binding domain-containing protein [Limnochordaceae bacterium]